MMYGVPKLPGNTSLFKHFAMEKTTTKNNKRKNITTKQTKKPPIYSNVAFYFSNGANDKIKVSKQRLKRFLKQPLAELNHQYTFF